MCCSFKLMDMTGGELSSKGSSKQSTALFAKFIKFKKCGVIWRKFECQVDWLVPGGEIEALPPTLE